MKKILAPSIPEKAEYRSDFSGKKFKGSYPQASVSFEFNYGSKHDGSILRFDLTDGEAEEVLTLISSRLCSKSRKELEKSLKLTLGEYDAHVESRDWEGCDQLAARSNLLQSLLSKSKASRNPEG